MSAASATSEGRQPSSSPANLLRRWFDEVWNQGKEEAIDQLLAENALMWGVNRPDTCSTGSGDFKQFYHTVRSAFSDTNITIHHVVEQGDTAFARWTVTATHSGDSLGTPASNKELKLTGISGCRVANGLIVEAWNIWDQIGMARQLGALSGHAVNLFP